VRLRWLTDSCYRLVMAPAAVMAIGSGTALLLVREIHEPWMAAKLAAVGLLVGLHTWQGRSVTLMGERGDEHRPPPAALLIGLSILTMTAVLLLVLAKPAVPATLLPDWLLEPRYRPLSVEETPT
jgi:protoporphyrinogen IX oxidase